MYREALALRSISTGDNLRMLQTWRELFGISTMNKKCGNLGKLSEIAG
jgi:hypothetical protein